ncbi:cytochrome c biogenesis heme-transporting ATPase CcmA [Neptunicella sp. SCSIO 80796]|uniref:cytochrome c biogenesis heme-transporting ATPase CcmA n=1 Tax=Neptunicella plasticusilytica TaxID=3117012 RepID=UPI003A4DEC62
MALLVAEKITCVKSDRVLFSQLSLTLQAGQILHLQGPNGAGKTSLLRILVGLSQAQEGRILLNGEMIEDHPRFASQIIYIGHKTGLNPNLSAIENLQFWVTLQGIAEHINLFALLADLGLVGLEDIPVGHLSAGQQRRVALAKLWLKKAALWVLDEPFTALDAEAIALIEQRMQAYVRQGGAIILTSHQLLKHQQNLSSHMMEYQW